ncbi:MAG: proprotein convertase P-domain-containing protein [Bacteroidetes bacterium]|nr:proprotein convertase P-domain-containing protein [Bacteroidota bacterium]
MKKLNSNNKTITNAPSTGRGIKRLTMAVLLLLVSNWVTAQTTFSNTGSISIPASGNASTYPSNITVSGMSGVITTVTVSVTGFAHTNPDDIDLLVQSPSGDNILLMSDCGGTGDVTGRNYTWQEGGSLMSDNGNNASGTYGPTDRDPFLDSDNLPSPGPGNISNTNFNVLDGDAPNGVWKLFVRDDAGSNSGSISGGWSITITTCILPTPTASSDSPLCQGSTLNLTSSGGGTYAWTGPNSFTSAAQNPTVTNMTAAKAGVYTVVVTAAGGCTASATTTVVVNASPSGTPTASSASVCPGANVTLSANHFAKQTSSNTSDFAIPDNNATGITSNITVSGTGATASQLVSSVLINITHTYNADLDIFLKAPNGSQIELSTDNGSSGNNYTNTLFQTGGGNITSASAPMTGTYAPEQAFSTLTGTGDGTWSLIVKDDAGDDTGTLTDWTLTYNTISGVSYAWTSTPSGFTASVANPVANPTSNTTYEVIATAGGCPSAPASVSVTILTPPVAVASSNTPVCEEADLILNASGGTSYSWTGPSFTSSTQNPTISGATTAATGNYTVVVTNAFGCTDDETISVTVNDKPEVSVLTQTDVTCNGGSDGAIALDVTGGTAPFLFYDGANFSFDGTFSGYIAGSVSVTVTDDNGCEDIIGFNITEPGPISIADAGSDQLLCNSGTASVTGNTPTVGVGTWTIQNGTAAISNPSSPSTGLTGMAPGNIVLRYTIAQAGCGSNYDEVTLINSAGPPAQPGSISGVNIACPPLNGQVFSISPVADATSYQWYAGPGSTGINFASATNSTSVTVDFGATTNSGYTLRVVAVNGCGAGNYSSSSIRRTVSTPQLTGSTLACANETKVFTIPTPIVGATNYIWSVPAGATIDGNAGPFTTLNTTVTIAFPSVFTSGNVCVKAVGPCGIETTNRCITVSSVPARPVRVNGLNTACPGSTQSYSVPAVAGAVSYNWSLPANATIISGAGTNSVTISFASNYIGGNICASATNPCTTGTQECINVQRAIPSMPSYISGIAFGLCGTTQTYSIPADPSVLTYNWTVPSGAVITNGAGTNTVEVNMAGVSFPTAGNQYLQISVAKVNACAVGVPRVLNIQGVPQKATSISGPTGVCASESGITYSCPNMFGATNYQWNVPSGVSILAGQGTNSIVVEWGISPGVISVTASNSCGNSGTRTLPVAINCRVAGETSKSVKLLAYPNPASDEVTVYFESNTEASTQFEILDVMGRVIKSQNIIPVVGSNEIVIDLTGFAKGAYLVQLKSNEISSQTRLIVE